MIGLSNAGRRTRGALVVVALVLPLSMALGVLTPSAAQAASSFQSPTPNNGAVLTTTNFTVSASVPPGSAATTLSVTGKDAGGTQCQATRTSQSGQGSTQTLSISFPSAGACYRNLRWTATLSDGLTRSFSTNARPTTPARFDAQGSGAREVTFTWDRGVEQDLTGYTLYDGSGAVMRALDLSHCNGDTCAYGHIYDADNPGTHEYQLLSRRSGANCSSCDPSLESSRASSSATLVLPPPPPPSPTPSPTPTGGSSTGGGTTGGSTGGGTGGGSGGGTSGGSGGGTTGGSSTSGGTAVIAPKPPVLPTLSSAAIQRRAFALQFAAFAPSLRIPKLPPLPANFAAPQLAEEPLPDGTFDPTLAYEAPTEVVKETTVLRQFRDVAEVNTDDLAKGLAAGLILLLLAAHVRRFLAVKPDL